jgi:Rrf2 family protein
VRLSLTRQADHAVRAMVWLAGQPAGDRRKAAEIAEAVHIPPPFAARVLSQLNKQGLLDARAGHDGGYTLARPSAGVSLLEIIEAIEGPLRSRTCLLRDAQCGEGGQHCPLHDAWSTAQATFRDALATTTLTNEVETHGN